MAMLRYLAPFNSANASSDEYQTFTENSRHSIKIDIENKSDYFLTRVYETTKQ